MTQIVTQWANETVPEAAPQNVHAEAEDSSSIRVTWDPPPIEQQNGHIAYYKLYYVEASRPEQEAVEVMLKSPQPSGTEFLLEELKKWTQYRIWLLAGTTVGDGPRSDPITVRTQEDGTVSTLPSVESFERSSGSISFLKNIRDSSHSITLFFASLSFQLSLFTKD